MPKIKPKRAEGEEPAIRFEVSLGYDCWRTDNGMVEVSEVVAQHYVGTGLYELVKDEPPKVKARKSAVKEASDGA